MTTTSTQESDTTRSFGKYNLVYNSKESPIGIEKGKVVTADLAVVLPEFNVVQYFSSQPTIFCDYDHVVTAYAENGAAIGLIGARWLGNEDVRFLYLWTAMIGDEYRKSMMFNRMVNFFFEKVVGNADVKEVPSLVVTKTYNPIVYNIFKSFSLAAPSGIDIYPQIPAAEQKEDMVALAKQVAAAISKSLVLEPDNGKVVGGQAMVAPDFFPRMEESKDVDVNRHFQKHLTRSDQILCILRISDDMRHSAFELVTRGRVGTPSKEQADGAQA